MATYKTQAIVIKRLNFGETDRILTLFTRNHGKIRVVAKGVRKPLSKLSGHLESFCLTNLILAEGRNLDVVAGAVTEDFFSGLRENLQLITQAFKFGELIDSIMEDNQANDRVFDLLVKCLKNIEVYQKKALDIYFGLNILALSGFKPELYECVSCREKINEKVKWSSPHGGVVCDKCQIQGTKRIDSSVVKVFRFYLNNDIGILKKIKMTEAQLNESQETIDEYIRQILCRELASNKVLEKIRGEYVKVA